MKSRCFIIVILVVSLSNYAFSQDGNSSLNKKFSEVKRIDFTRLIGIDQNFDGLTLKYDKDKSVVNVGQGFSLGENNILNVTANVGTSSDISTLFNQDILPTFGINASFHRYIYLQYYYDRAYNSNYSSLAGSGDVSSVHTDYPGRFDYKNHIRENIRKGKYDAVNPVYTFKEVYWWSITAKYNNDKYGFFDNQRPFKSQQYDTLSQTFNVQAAISGYRGWNNSDYQWKPYAPEYLFGTLYLFGGRNNNIGDLKKTTVSDVKEIIVDTMSKTSRQVMGKSENYYQGKLYEYSSFGFGGKLYFSPIKMLTISIFGEYRFIKSSDKKDYNLNDNASFGAGLYLYSGSTSKSNINIGINYKRTKNVTDTKWTNKLEFATSIPISLFE